MSWVQLNGVSYDNTNKGDSVFSDMALVGIEKPAAQKGEFKGGAKCRSAVGILLMM